LSSGGGGRSGRARRQKRGGRLLGPRGLTVDLRGNILVADDCSRVCMFNSSGRYVRNLLTDEDSVKYPEAVHCSRSGSGLLAITEWNPNSMYAVKVFTLYEWLTRLHSPHDASEWCHSSQHLIVFVRFRHRCRRWRQFSLIIRRLDSPKVSDRPTLPQTLTQSTRFLSTRVRVRVRMRFRVS